MTTNEQVRQQAWDDLQHRKNELGYTPEQLKLVQAGMFTMWRLMGLDARPLFTFGPDGQPRELSE